MFDTDKPETPEEVLEHHGVKGQRWGVRKAGAAISTSAKLNLEVAKDSHTVKKTGGRYNTSQTKTARGARQVVKEKKSDNPQYAKAADRQAKVGKSLAVKVIKNYAAYKLIQLTVRSVAGGSASPYAAAGTTYHHNSARGASYVNTKPPMMKATVNSKGVFNVSSL